LRRRSHAAKRPCKKKERAARLRPVGAQVEYIADLAQHFLDRAIHVQRWPGMDDEAVIAELIQVRGIGRWTAEMFLIFSLLRPDVFRSTTSAAEGSARRISGTAGSRCEPWSGSAKPGDPGARSRPGTFGARSTRCR